MVQWVVVCPLLWLTVFQRKCDRWGSGRLTASVVLLQLVVRLLEVKFSFVYFSNVQWPGILSTFVGGKFWSAKLTIGRVFSLDKFLIFIDYIFLRSCRRYRKIVCPYVQHGWCFDNRWYCDADCSFLHEEIWVAEPYFRKRNCVVGVGSSRCRREVLCCLNVVFLVFHFTDCGNKVRTK